MIVVDGLCTCCGLPPDQCGKAAEERARAEEHAERKRLILRGWLPAQHASPCSMCGEWIKPGDLIAPSPSGTGWRGRCCL